MIAHYPEFTGDQWLDGVIWGCGSKVSLRSARLRVSELPCRLVDEISDRLERAGLETDLVEMPNSITKQTDLCIAAVAAEERFRELPRFSLRRVLESHPPEFCDGYMISRIAPRRLRTIGDEEAVFSFNRIRLVIHCGESRNAIMAILDARGDDYKESGKGGIEMNPECYVHEPFKTYLSALESEYADFRTEVENGDEVLETLQEEAVKRRRSKILEIKITPQSGPPIKLTRDAFGMLDLLRKGPRRPGDLQRYFGNTYASLVQELRDSQIKINLLPDLRYALTVDEKECEACGRVFESVQGLGENLCPSCRDVLMQKTGTSLFG